MSASNTSGFNNVFARGFWVSKRNIFLYSSIKENSVLRNNTYLPAERVKLDFTNINIIN